MQYPNAVFVVETTIQAVQLTPTQQCTVNMDLLEIVDFL